MKQADSPKPYKLPIIHPSHLKNWFSIFPTALGIWLLLITLIRIYFLYNNHLDLYADEAQYYDWSKDLAFGYYSKPPMIALMIKISCLIFGDHEAGVRLFSPILHLLTSINIYFIARKLYNEKIGCYSSIIYLTFPAITLSSALITTDPILLFFWSITSLFFIYELWIWAGIAFGLGLLTKYNMVIFIPSAMIYLYYKHKNFIPKAVGELDLILSGERTECTKKYMSTRIHDKIKNQFFKCEGYIWLKNPSIYLSVLIGLLIYSPNFIWNLNHGFVSYLHTKEISQIEKYSVSFTKMIEFLLAQIAIIGPVMSLIVIRSFRNIKSHKLVSSLFLPIFLFTLFLSFISNAYGNWAAPAYVFLSIFIASSKRFLNFAIISNILISILLYCYPLYEDKLPIDPYKRIRGWSDLGKQVSMISSLHPDALIISDDRKIIAELIYYTKSKDKIRKYNPTRNIRDHYDMTISVDHIAKEAILVFKKPTSELFSHCQERYAHNNANICYIIPNY